MEGKQEKVLFDHHVQALLAYAQHSRHPVRNRLIVLLSVKAGLRAGEIANLTWPMVLDPSGEIATYIELHDGAAKTGVAAGSHFIMICGKRWPGGARSATDLCTLWVPNAAAA